MKIRIPRLRNLGGILWVCRLVGSCKSFCRSYPDRIRPSYSVVIGRISSNIGRLWSALAGLAGLGSGVQLLGKHFYEKAFFLL